ncbi:MAG: SDR family NAD(P)-dependent oxidoreductase, partial [Gammaproteobacteria bacterium]
GHLEAAAGIAGFIKTLLALQHEEIPKHLHFKQLNPQIMDLAQIPAQLPLSPLAWKKQEGHVRRAGISSFSFSGTNAHVILEEAPLQYSTQVKQALSKTVFNRQRYWPNALMYKRKAHIEADEIHPLLGVRLNAHAKDENITFEQILDIKEDNLKYLQDHQIFHHVIFPGVGYLELGITAAKNLSVNDRMPGLDTWTLSDIKIEQPLVLSQEGILRLQTSLITNSEGIYEIEIYSQDSKENWQLHARLKVKKLIHGYVPEKSASLADIERACPEEVNIPNFYARASAQGIQYGPAFQTLTSLRYGHEHALGVLTVHESMDSRYQVYPPLLDGCLQVISTLLNSEKNKTYLPTQIGEVILYHALPSTVLVHAQGKAIQDGPSLKFSSINVYSLEGECLARIKDIELRAIQQKSLEHLLGQEDYHQWYYDETWHIKTWVHQSQQHSYVKDWRDLTHSWKLANEEIFSNIDRPAVNTLNTLLETLSVDYILLALHKAGVNWQVQGKFIPPAVVAKYHQQLNQCLNILVSHAYLQADGTILQSLPEAKILQTQIAEHLAQALMLSEIEPTLLSRCGTQLLEIWLGQEEALGLLFPADVQAISAATLYEQSPFSQHLNSLVAKVIETLVAAADRPVRILEIGAGTGGTTSFVLKSLKSDVIYTYTDISAGFFAKAQEKFTEYPFIHYQVLDIEQDPLLQGFVPNEYDIVIAANVLHATRDTHETLKHINQVLAPKGVLCLFEGIQPKAWLDLTFGLLEGWWRFNDERDYPLMTPKQWQTALKATGFGKLGVYDQELAAIMVAVKERTENKSQRKWLLLQHGHKKLKQQFSNIGDVTVMQLNTELADTLPNIFSSQAFDDVVYYVNKSDIVALKDWVAPYLTILQACGRASFNKIPRIHLITQSSQAVTNHDCLHPEQAILWGMSKVFMREYPLFKISCIDIDEHTDRALLINELLADDAELQVALRQGIRYVGRLEKSPLSALLIRPASNFALTPSPTGLLQDMQLLPMSELTCLDNEVLIQVKAAGVNFKDLLISQGRYLDTVSHIGFECAGIVIAKGKDVQHLSIGAEVFGFAQESFATQAKSRTEFLQIKPAQLSFAQAAGLPTVFATVYEAFSRAWPKPGQSILIHAATGGIGSAAIQLAKHLGLKIYATAGSEEKRAYVRSLGVEAVMNSRDLSFAQTVKELTAGHGVDYVLNSLTGAFIPASLALVTNGGYFFEIGKTNIWTTEQVQVHYPNVHYEIVALDQIILEQPERASWLLKEINELLAQHYIEPLPVTPFSIQEAVIAFHYMQQTKHIGKIIFLLEEEKLLFKSDATYLITGGLGGIGLALTDWLIAHGAQHIALFGRHSSNEEYEKKQIEWQPKAQVMAFSVDMTSKASIKQGLQEMVTAEFPALKGVFYCADIFADATFPTQTWDKYQTVLEPKVFGSWYLHELTQHLPLDHFVLFSSMASLLGTPGQSNHAAANAFLDNLAYYRRQHGLRTQSINWGAWSQIGYAAREGVKDATLAPLGSKTFTPLQAFACLEEILLYGSTRVSVMPIDWTAYFKTQGNIHTAWHAKLKP